MNQLEAKFNLRRYASALYTPPSTELYEHISYKNNNLLRKIQELPKLNQRREFEMVKQLYRNKTVIPFDYNCKPDVRIVNKMKGVIKKEYMEQKNSSNTPSIIANRPSEDSHLKMSKELWPIDDTIEEDSFSYNLDSVEDSLSFISPRTDKHNGRIGLPFPELLEDRRLKSLPQIKRTKILRHIFDQNSFQLDLEKYRLALARKSREQFYAALKTKKDEQELKNLEILERSNRKKRIREKKIAEQKYKHFNRVREEKNKRRRLSDILDRMPIKFELSQRAKSEVRYDFGKLKDTNSKMMLSINDTALRDKLKEKLATVEQYLEQGQKKVSNLGDRMVLQTKMKKYDEIMDRRSKHRKILRTLKPPKPASGVYSQVKGKVTSFRKLE